MSLLSEIVDPAINDYKEVRKIVEELTLEEVTEILDRRRTPSNPTHTWRVWQNELKRWQNVLIGRDSTKDWFGRVQEKFYGDDGITEQMETYGYLELNDQEWIFNTMKKLLDILEGDLYGAD